MRTRFICTVKSEAILKALFKVKDDDLTFQRAVKLEQEIEEFAKVAKETVHKPSISQLQRFSTQNEGQQGNMH